MNIKNQVMKKYFSMWVIICLILIIVTCAKQENNIKIGAVLALTGAASEWGQNQKNGMELAVKELNDIGGIDGKKVRLYVEDNMSESKSAINGFNKLIIKRLNWIGDWGFLFRVADYDGNGFSDIEFVLPEMSIITDWAM